MDNLRDNTKTTWCTVYPDRSCSEDNCCIPKINEDNLRLEKLSLCIGTIVGQISEILNNIKYSQMTNDMVYNSLVDIHRAAALQIHEIYYKVK